MCRIVDEIYNYYNNKTIIWGIKNDKKNIWYEYYFYNIDTASCKQSNIVFDILKSGQIISKTAVDKLNGVLTNNRVTGLYPAISTQTLYINSNGPNYQGAATDDKIYIDCQPTGEEGKELYKETKDIGKESRVVQRTEEILLNHFLSFLEFLNSKHLYSIHLIVYIDHL